MVMLAIDTCFEGCSAALFGPDGKTVVAQRFEMMQRGHAERLPVMVDEVFKAAGETPDRLTRVAVTRGPGTFTGLRIGLSYGKGLALARHVPMVGIDSLLAIAAGHLGQAQRLTISHKAGGTGHHYAAVYDGADLSVVHAPALVDDQTLATWREDACPIADQAPDAAVFGAFALGLTATEMTHAPLYLREADAKPNASAAMSTITTRHATTDDIALLAELHAASIHPAWTAEMFQSSLSLPGAGAILVELANRAYGFVQFQAIAEEAEINTFCVLPNYRRQGFGKATLSALVTYLRQHNTRRLFLEVAEDNGAALSLYEANGFVRTGVRKNYYARASGAVDAVMMARDL